MSSVRHVVLQKGVSGYGFLLRDERPCVVDCVFPGSAAEQAQMHPGDLLLSINGFNVTDRSHDEVFSLICSTTPLLELSLLACDELSTRHFQHYYSDLSQLHLATSKSPLFLYNSAVSHHKRSFIVKRIGKLAFDSHMEMKHSQLIRRLIPLKLKADQALKEDCPLDTYCLFELFSDCLRIHLTSRSLGYCNSDLIFTGTIEEDRRFFYLLVHGRCRQPYDGSDAAAQPSADSRVTLCYLFRCLPPKLLGHRSHSDITEKFGVTCHRDKLTGECAEFPRTVAPLVTDLLSIINCASYPRTRFAETASQWDSSIPYRIGTNYGTDHGLSTDQPPRTANTSTTATPCPNFKRPATPPRTSSAHLLGKFAKAASYLKLRWNDKRCSSVQSPVTPYARNPKSMAKSTLRHSVATTSANLTDTPTPVCVTPIGIPKQHTGIRTRSSTSIESQHSTISTSPSRTVPLYTDFDSLLADPLGLKNFEAFLASEFSAENIHFWREIRRWRTEFPMLNVKAECLRIFSHFIDPCSPNAVNVDDIAVKQATAHLQCPTRDMFSEAENQVYRLMKTDSFPRFLASSRCSMMLSADDQYSHRDRTQSLDVTGSKGKKTTSRKPVISTPAARMLSLDTTTLGVDTPICKTLVPLRSNNLKGCIRSNISSFRKDFRARVLHDRSNLQS
ncbi:unnamed protein product [Dicrocoelium dendriticum]|nr:unnamed protein product [Dicrocoelium dendriticum]